MNKSKIINNIVKVKNTKSILSLTCDGGWWLLSPRIFATSTNFPNFQYEIGNWIRQSTHTVMHIRFIIYFGFWMWYQNDIWLRFNLILKLNFSMHKLSNRFRLSTISNNYNFSWNNENCQKLIRANDAKKPS